jgi:hypothetical protein
VIAHFVKDDYVLFIYSSMEEAEKAQRALNFVVIHGKTIMVKLASPAEMAMIMDCKKPPQPFFGGNQMYLNGCSNEQSSASANGWMNNNMIGGAAVGNKWAFDKSNNSPALGNALWGMSSNDRDAANAVSMQNLLPGDLLGESS